MSKETVLVVAAHPDDEVLGCGGTMAKLAKAGHSVHVAILGEGATSRSAKREEADLGEVEKLRMAAREAGKMLGAAKVHLFGFPDNRFDSVPLLDIVKIIEQLIAELRPSIIFTQHGGDLNIDHVLTQRAVLTAARPLPGACVKEIYCFEAPSSTEWSFGQFEPSFRPNFFVEMASSLEDKLKALSCYESEERIFPHPRSPEALRSMARRWGAVVGVPAAEAFEQIRRTI
ncbi:MAG: GlcNAc-PI de-N-acetylase [Lentisphaerae bacterium GWF2_52_8]|nr:MAG: GlcNAc-PI de-N-acetylase [Lentisphaerae bacterium GWF2_52_8]